MELATRSDGGCSKIIVRHILKLYIPSHDNVTMYGWKKKKALCNPINPQTL